VLGHNAVGDGDGRGSTTKTLAHPVRPVLTATMACPKRLALRIALYVLLAGVILPLAAVAAESNYTVKRGDTLTGIARKYGVTVAALAERNSLSRNHYVTIGQKLVIPGGKPDRPKPETNSPTAPPADASLPKAIRDAINNEPIRAGRWKYIVIHHSATDEGTMRGMDEYHRSERNMEHGLAYHFVIGNGNGMKDGDIGVGGRWKEQHDGGHLRSESQNKVALGICLVGNFDARAPTAKQMENLKALVQALMKRCNIPASGVRTHQQINVIGTRCPGKKFPAREFLNSLKRTR
jgi:LysM repeat protein